MRKVPILLFLFLVLVMLGSNVFSCPVCSGRIDEDSPPFFSDEAYQVSGDSFLPYSEIVELEDDEEDLDENVTT